MRLLIDTDAFCKLGIAGLLQAVSDILSVPWSDCRRLPALPHMLQRGRLAKRLGLQRCSALLPIAQQLEVVGEAPQERLNQLVGVPDLDPGEAQLFAQAADSDDLLLSGDKRARRAVKSLPGISEILNLKIVTVEAALFALCTEWGDDSIRDKIRPALPLDTALGICFSADNRTPRDALKSYFCEEVKEVAPVVLWSPFR